MRHTRNTGAGKIIIIIDVIVTVIVNIITIIVSIMIVIQQACCMAYRDKVRRNCYLPHVLAGTAVKSTNQTTLKSLCNDCFD